MLKVPRVGGAAQLRLFVDEIGFARACKLLHVHENTMRRWLRGETPVPQAPLQALYWLTSWGFSDACSEAHWTHQFLLGKLRGLEAQLEAAQAELAWRAPAKWAAANDPAKPTLVLIAEGS
jgi:L-ascorbate metabolism protein UlaG (beta-lactamase superfamily)